MSDDERLRGDGPPPRMAARRAEPSKPSSPRSGLSHELVDDRPAGERRTKIIVATIGFLVGVLAIGPLWDLLGWPLAAVGFTFVALLAVCRYLAMTRSAIEVLRRVDQSLELLWHLAGWGVVGSGVVVVASGGIASGVALIAASLANMATSHRIGAVAVGVTGLALGALGISHVMADRTVGGVLLVTVALAVVVLGVVIFVNAGRAGRGPRLLESRSDVSRPRKR